jgi:antitoxin YefM
MQRPSRHAERPQPQNRPDIQFATLYNFLYANLGDTMRTVTYSEVRQNLAKMLDHVVDDAEEVVVTRSGREAAVIISLREYESLKETAYLMASPANARRLNEAIEELRSGGGEPHDLIDPDSTPAEVSAA